MRMRVRVIVRVVPVRVELVSLQRDIEQRVAVGIEDSLPSAPSYSAGAEGHENDSTTRAQINIGRQTRKWECNLHGCHRSHHDHENDHDHAHRDYDRGHYGYSGTMIRTRCWSGYGRAPGGSGCGHVHENDPNDWAEREKRRVYVSSCAKEIGT